MSLKDYVDLTQHEIHALKQTYNLADAHTHQSQSATQRNIIRRLPELWYESEQQTQHEMEQRFIKAFFTFHNQPAALKTPSMLVYASSIAMVMAANYFHKNGLTVAQITPCFDNLHDILKYMKVPTEPLMEEWLHDPETLYSNLVEHITADVLFIVSPNNPTGWDLTGRTGSQYKRGFEELIRYAKDHNKILSFDFCFASTIIHDDNVPTFDVYELLEESGVRYISYEDTGKTWPLQDAKVAILKCSKDVFRELYDISTSYLLNVSPFILNLVTQYIEDSIADEGASIIDLLKTNRAVVTKYLNSDLLEVHQPKTQMSVAWVRILDPNKRATDLQQQIYDKEEVYVLPGTYFFWDNPKRGERYLRIALARDTELLTKAVKRIARALEIHQSL
ncbi:MAG: aspartate/tyrosine/aromatic aminotransferase [Candidatus Kerfeldbacteria bacterium CG15_BIG_FIL_POST_REV_8_21_14_020_45_12]|uniref:Aspartate/tyrosine/aromatic aminotransferase n=1 Tax=Candidatus Kerfeldbacteria bacterium CG15_BIG_FIL_POST_REV_8_21_14_020_45_12 TaxID=2014247 RepID=A0A2M7H454_9BACT|nr:MAG: aspartate/tyrosine/aromatic aminotransferase [Candidatus Kerfeldbacteria bacterium CG15_BIG_FIL_POST_REV_8_21_14_020_45_12]PJA92856.1 MAG: aspartate/tyrosine/aromatic aminotransferase [Candidatus Kerfeldbacteria bacterium CG_4_9_14_3_um_filter_45_8]